MTEGRIHETMPGPGPVDLPVPVYVAAPFRAFEHDGYTFTERENIRRAAFIGKIVSKSRTPLGRRRVAIVPHLTGDFLFGPDEDPDARHAAVSGGASLAASVAIAGGEIWVLTLPGGGLSEGVQAELRAFEHFRPRGATLVKQWARWKLVASSVGVSEPLGVEPARALDPSLDAGTKTPEVVFESPLLGVQVVVAEDAPEDAAVSFLNSGNAWWSMRDHVPQAPAPRWPADPTAYPYLTDGGESARKSCAVRGFTDRLAARFKLPSNVTPTGARTHVVENALRDPSPADSDPSSWNPSRMFGTNPEVVARRELARALEHGRQDQALDTSVTGPECFGGDDFEPLEDPPAVLYGKPAAGRGGFNVPPELVSAALGALDTSVDPPPGDPLDPDRWPVWRSVGFVVDVREIHDERFVVGVYAPGVEPTPDGCIPNGLVKWGAGALRRELTPSDEDFATVRS